MAVQRREEIGFIVVNCGGLDCYSTLKITISGVNPCPQVVSYTGLNGTFTMFGGSLSNGDCFWTASTEPGDDTGGVGHCVVDGGEFPNFSLYFQLQFVCIGGQFAMGIYTLNNVGAQFPFFVFASDFSAEPIGDNIALCDYDPITGGFLFTNGSYSVP